MLNMTRMWSGHGVKRFDAVLTRFGPEPQS